MDAQYENHRRRLAVHGIMVFFVGLILGIPFGLAQQEIADLGSGLVAGYGHELAFTMGADIADELQGDVRRWRIAHNQGLQHGFLLLALAAAIPLVRLTKSQLKVASVAVVVGAWGAVIGSTIAAIYEVNGRSFTPPLANRIAFVLLGIGVMGVLLGLAIGLLRAALDAIRGGLLGGRWFNWARNVEIRPRRLAKPTSLSQLKIEVADAYAAHMNVRAVGGGYSWSPMAITDGVMIDMSKLNQAIGDIVTNNDGTGEITVQAGMKMSELTDLLATRSLTLSTTTVIPMVQVGGALAMGCHGTGIHHPIFPELVSAMKVVNYQGLEQDYTRPPPLPAMPTPAELDAHKVWNALIVNLGALGIVYSLTFDCVPMFRVRAVDEIADMNTTLLGIKAIVQSNEYAEIFAFPFNQKCWVKTWNTTTDPIGPVGWPTARAGVQWLQNRILAPLLLHPLSLVPFLTPIVTKMFFSMVQQTEAGNRVMRAPDAMQYQTSFMRAVDLGHAIPVDPNYDSVRRAWYGVMDRLSALDADKIYAQNLVVHMRFVGKGSALLAPSSGNDVTCYIEILTFHNTTRYEEYFARIELAWMRLGGKPHWGKLVFEPDRVSELYDKNNLADFLEVRQRLDPEEVFVNPYLRRVLGLW